MDEDIEKATRSEEKETRQDRELKVDDLETDGADQVKGGEDCSLKVDEYK